MYRKDGEGSFTAERAEATLDSVQPVRRLLSRVTLPIDRHPAETSFDARRLGHGRPRFSTVGADRVHADVSDLGGAAWAEAQHDEGT
jgi:hypothetical protein